jgi:hypothetical protein
MRVFKTGNSNIKRLAHTSSVRPILEHWSASWDPCRKGQINALDRVQRKAAQFTNHTKNSDWKTLAQRRAIAQLCVLFKWCCGGRAGKGVHDSLRRPFCLSGVHHDRKIMDRRQRRISVSTPL